MKKILLSLLLIIASHFAAAEDANKVGQQIYEQACQTCHNPNTAPLMGAPTAHDMSLWQPRLNNAKNAIKNNSNYKTIWDFLIAEVKAGKNAMIPGGMCVDNSTSDGKCKDQDYKAAIQFMSAPKK
jgi:cytochrome c5